MFIQLFLVCITVTEINSQLTAATCNPASTRLPGSSDITVTCGTNSISLAIQICPAIYAGFNESLLFVNGVINDPNCKGTLDNTASPPLLRFTFPIGTTNSCGSTFMTTTTTGTGQFSDFSNVQSLNISGMVHSYDTSMSIVTYNSELKYFYSCAYPLQYLMNNTRLDVSTSSIAIKDKNGSFISTLSLRLFSDGNYFTPLNIPTQGIDVKSNVFVQVKATNLTGQYNVLLDRCYASTSPYPTNSTYYNLFVGCSKSPLTNVTENGVSQSARFFFSAFRFTEQQNQSFSRYYLHCITRLCELTACSTFTTCTSNRRKRAVEPDTLSDGITETTTLTSPLIITRADSIGASTKEQALASSNPGSESSKGLGVAVGILACACIGMLVIGTLFYKKLILCGTSKILPK